MSLLAGGKCMDPISEFTLLILTFIKFDTFRRKDVGHFPLTYCLYLKYISSIPGISPEPYFHNAPYNSHPGKVTFTAFSVDTFVCKVCKVSQILCRIVLKSLMRGNVLDL